MIRMPRPLPLRMLAATLALALLAGCSILGGGDRRDAATNYAPDPRVSPAADWPTVDWQLSIGTPMAPRAIDNFRISVRPTPDELQVYRGATWARTPSMMLEDTVLRGLEDSGRLPAVTRQGAGVLAEYKLVMDLRRFEADYAGQPVPSATIEVNAKLVHARSQAIVANRTFLHAEPAGDTAVPQVVTAFSRALERVGGDIGGWVLQSGQAHQGSLPPSPAGPPAPLSPAGAPHGRDGDAADRTR